VKIRDVPGFAVVATKPKPVQQKAQQKAPQKTKKMRTKKFLVVSLGVIVALLVVGGSVAGVSYYLIGDGDEDICCYYKRHFYPITGSDCRGV
jgi:multisubunit Na+/H+ antiporter MnhB subunit